MGAATRIISGILSFVFAISPFGFGGNAADEGGVKTVTVALDGSGDYTTIEAARDYIRTLDKTEYDGIEVNVKAGVYQITEAIVFTEEDTGTETCPITYRGEDGAEIVGGAFLYAKDFTKAEGGLTEYFPEEVRDSIVMTDMKKFGFTAADFADNMRTDTCYEYLEFVPFFSANGNIQTLAQYPNGTWLHVGEVVTHSEDGTTNTAIDGKTIQTINYGEEHFETVTSWSEAVPVYVIARLFKLWCPDDSVVVDINKENPTVDILFAGGHEPEIGTVMYFYNVPEELDIPGEYIYDKDGILYYYPTEDFETAEFTVPLSDGIIKIDGADYLTFDNLVLSTTRGKGMDITGNHITVKNCEIAATGEQGISANGDAFLLDSSSVHHTTRDAVTVHSGDIATMTGGGSRVHNCDIYEFGLSRSYGYAVTMYGVDLLIDHNDVHDGDFKALDFCNSANAICEYNEVWNASRLAEDCGVLGAGSRENYNVVFRYNYIHDCFPEDEASRKVLEYNPDYLYFGSFAFYHDGGSSYIQVYGNVIDGVDNGFLSNGGRGNTFTGNLVVNCRRWYVWFSDWTYADMLDAEKKPTGSTSYNDYVYSDLWKEANPDLAATITSPDGIDPLDPMFWAAPTGCVCANNWIHFNKADRYFKNWGVRPYYIEDYMTVFCPDTMEADENHVSTYSSMKTGVDIEDLVKNVAAGVIEITWDQFCEIGRIAD